MCQKLFRYKGDIEIWNLASLKLQLQPTTQRVSRLLFSTLCGCYGWRRSVLASVRMSQRAQNTIGMNSWTRRGQTVVLKQVARKQAVEVWSSSVSPHLHQRCHVVRFVCLRVNIKRLWQNYRLWMFLYHLYNTTRISNCLLSCHLSLPLTLVEARREVSNILLLYRVNNIFAIRCSF